MNEATIKSLIKSKAETLDDLAKIKRKLSKKYKIPFSTNINLLKTYHELVENKKDIIRFIEKQLSSSSPKTRKKAQFFLNKYSI